MDLFVTEKNKKKFPKYILFQKKKRRRYIQRTYVCVFDMFIRTIYQKKSKSVYVYSSYLLLNLP